jgi:dihydropteroate synthase
MGIINVTPDSFSDGGDFFKVELAINHGLSLADEGADILDIGGESTRPFSYEITADEEIRRIAPVIEALAKKITIPISVDTTKSKVAKAAINAGASIINDISALRFDPHMADVAAGFKTPVILMHMKGTPKNMQANPVYDDLLGEIYKFFSDAVNGTQDKGILRSNIIIDPGIGFGKTFDHNLIILKNLNKFLSLDLPILVGPSRKAFIRNLVKEKGVKDINPKQPEVETGTQAAITVAVLNGAHIIRTHNVKNTRVTLKIVDAIKRS